MIISSKIVNIANILTGIRIFSAVFALSTNSLAFNEINADGLRSLILLIGMSALFFLKKDSSLQKNIPICFLSAFFSLCTAFGKSYHDFGNWELIFKNKIQFVVATIFILGYYYIFKHIIIFTTDFITQHPNILRCEAKGAIEKHLYGKHAYSFLLIIFASLTLPYYIAFFPGTIHADATEQLFQHFGYTEITGHHPILITKLMGICVEIGKNLFNSDNIGIALYTTPQLICQLLVFSYAVWLMCKLNVPIIFRWFALFMYGIFPLFPMYAITLAKDTGYYVSALLFLVTLIHICHDKEGFIWWNRVLLVLASIGLCIFRKEGKYIVITVLLVTLWQYRNKSRILLLSITLSLLTIFLIEGVYMPHKGISKGGVQETLSLPLQQTARYLREHYTDIPKEELDELQTFFSKDIETIAEKYQPEISDPVKYCAIFHAENGGVVQYFKVWFKGLLTHPGTYIQAFLNHVYGYFYPDRGCYDNHIKYFFTLVGYDRWQTPFLDISFVMQDEDIRSSIREYTEVWNRLPVLKLLYSPGMYVYILLGCFVYLLHIQERKGTCMILLSLLVFATCIVSPANAYLRYTFPLIALTPLNLAWCFVMKRDS